MPQALTVISKKLGGSVSDGIEILVGTPLAFVGKGYVIIVPGNSIGVDLAEQEHAIFLRKIAVAEKGTGLGTKFMEALIDYSNESGKTLFLEDVVNIKFFKPFGFAREGQDWILHNKDISGT